MTEEGRRHPPAFFVMVAIVKRLAADCCVSPIFSPLPGWVLLQTIHRRNLVDLSGPPHFFLRWGLAPNRKVTRIHVRIRKAI